MRNPAHPAAKLAIGAAALVAVALLTLWWLAGSGAGPAGTGERDGAGVAGGADARATGDAARHGVGPAVARGFWHAPAGSEFAYRFAAEVESRIAVTLADQPVRQGTDLSLGGTVTMLIAARREAEL